MKIVYLCPTGTYSSLVAANLHLGKIGKEASVEEILQLPNFSRFEKKYGLSFYLGQDEEKRSIYTLGVANESQIIIKSAQDLQRIMGSDLSIKYVDVSRFVPNYYAWCSALLPKKIIAKRIKDRLEDLEQFIKST